MKQKRYTEAQILGFLKEAESGMPVKELCRKHGFSDASFYNWRSKYGGMELSDIKRLKALERENARLKKLLAESLGISRWTVYSRLEAATNAMRAALEADARTVVPATHRQEALR